MASAKIGFGLCVIYFLIGFSQLHTLIPGIRYLKLGVLCSMFLFILVIPYIKEREWVSPLGKLMIFFIISVIPGIFIGYATGKTRIITITLIQDFIAGFLGMCFFVNTPKKIYILNTIILVSTAFIAVYVLANGGHGPGILDDENDVGLALTMLFPFSYFTITLYPKKIHKILMIVLMFLVLAAIARTVSRGAMVGILPTLLIIWLRSNKKLLTLFLFTIALFGVVAFGPKELISEFKSIKNTNEGTAGTRRYFWELSIEMFKKRPIFGVGAQGWGNAVWSGLIFLPKHVSNSTPHSLYFQLISELGTVGILAWLLLISSVFKVSSTIEKNKNYLVNSENNETTNYDGNIILSFNNAIKAGLIGSLICGLFLSFLFYSHIYFMVTLAQLTYINFRKQVSLNYNKESSLSQNTDEYYNIA